MYVVSVKSSKLKLIIAAFAVIGFIALAVIYLIGGGKASPEISKNGVSFRAQTEAERLEFLSQFGWEIDEETAPEVKEVVIPETFDEVYERYNTLQKEQGFDLQAYCGARVKEWSYRVLNYPGYEHDSVHIRANLLVANGVVIGGDVSSVELDGFMQTFEMPQETTSTADDAVSQPVEHP